VRELPEEKVLVIYNNADKARTLEIPIDDTLMENAHQLQTLFGNVSAEIDGGKVRVNLPARTTAIFGVH
jgi:hypothetical protein